MKVQIKNENYGYRVSTYGDYVTVSNPATFRWDYATASVFYTGSVDFFRYNKNTDQHDYIDTIYQNREEMDVVLDTENSLDLRTELLSSVYRILIDKNIYTIFMDNGFGYSLDMYEKLVVIGSPYYIQSFVTSASVFSASGSTVEIHDLSRTEFLSLSQSSYVASLYNPALDVTESFGHGVSINNAWIAVGSPYVSSSRGVVYMYKNVSAGGNYAWSFYQTIEPSDSLSDALFGWDLKLNKQIGSISQSLVVGCGNNANGRAYYFEFVNEKWFQTYEFSPTTNTMPLTFGGYIPYQPSMSLSSSFGCAVSTFDNTVVIGAPRDRTVYEFSGSSLYEQGSVTVFERCPDEPIIPLTPYENTFQITPNANISFGVGDSSNVAILIGSASIMNEAHPHASIVVNNKFYCGGLDGGLYVLIDPANNPSSVISASCIAGDKISAVVYSDVTEYLYFINGNTTGVATGSIIRVDPDNIVNGQTIFYQGLPGGGTLAPLVCDGPYLYTLTNSFIYKIDVITGILVDSVSVSWGGAHGGTISTDRQWIYFSIQSPGQIIKVNPSDLTYTSSPIIINQYPTCCTTSSISDDIAYLNGYIYANPDGSDGDIYKINDDDLSYETYPTAFNSLGTFADLNNVYHLQFDELWIYFDGNIQNGPVRVSLPGIGSYNINEFGIIDNFVFIVTRWNTNEVFVYRLQWAPSMRSFREVFKTYGNSNILKNNRLGYSVDVFDGNIVAGIPKINNESMTSCYLGGTLDQLHDCEGNPETTLNGQMMLLQKNTSSLDWEIANVYQKKKRYLSPYRAFGDDVAIADRSMVIGAPMSISGTNREITIQTTQSNNIELDDISGKAYIYNLKNLRDEFHVGNVFYRNGKIVVMTSGSSFDRLCYNSTNVQSCEYDLQFKGQHTIFEKQIICSVNPGEFNVSTNPSATVIPTSSLDINKNGRVDFQDVDVILRYMQYKNTSLYGVPVSTDWSSSVVVTDDEISLLNYYQSADGYSDEQTAYLTSESIVRWEMSDTWMQDVLDLNDDNRIDILDMKIMWKYFTNRLTQENYAGYTTPSCKNKLFSDVIDYLNFTTQKTTLPQISPLFLDYERLSALDKTGSFLAPMVTSVGLFSGLDLVAVAKLGSPVKLIPELPFNFAIRIDF